MGEHTRRANSDGVVIVIGTRALDQHKRRAHALHHFLAKQPHAPPPIVADEEPQCRFYLRKAVEQADPSKRHRNTSDHQEFRSETARKQNRNAWGGVGPRVVVVWNGSAI